MYVTVDLSLCVMWFSLNIFVCDHRLDHQRSFNCSVRKRQFPIILCACHPRKVHDQSFVEDSYVGSFAMRAFLWTVLSSPGRSTKLCRVNNGRSGTPRASNPRIGRANASLFHRARTLLPTTYRPGAMNWGLNLARAPGR